MMSLTFVLFIYWKDSAEASLSFIETSPYFGLREKWTVINEKVGITLDFLHKLIRVIT